MPESLVKGRMWQTLIHTHTRAHTHTHTHTHTYGPRVPRQSRPREGE